MPSVILSKVTSQILYSSAQLMPVSITAQIYPAKISKTRDRIDCVVSFFMLHLALANLISGTSR